MRRVAWLLVVAFAGSGEADRKQVDWNQVRMLGGAANGPASLASLRVMTWNIDHGDDLDKIARGMRTGAADLYLLQEVDWNTARAGEKDVGNELAGRLGFAGAYGIEFEELSQKRGKEPAYIGQATLTRLAVRRSRVLRFQKQSGFWKPHGWIPSSMAVFQRRLGDRIALVTELEWRGGLLVVYNAHLESRSAGGMQEAQLDEMLGDAGQYAPGTTILLGGDLNTKYWASTFLHRLETAGFHSALGEKIERTHKIAMALDWIFVKGPGRLEGGVVRRDIGGSDHYPVWVRLTAGG